MPVSYWLRVGYSLLTSIFYNVLRSSIGEMVVESFNEAYEEGEMSNSRRQGVITLIEKTGKDRTGDRSLTNVDSKIASKVIAN